MKIVVTHRSGDWQACLEGRTGIWGCGLTPDAAIGALIRSHQTEFQIFVELAMPPRTGPADPTEDNLNAAAHGASEGDSFSRTRL